MGACRAPGDSRPWGIGSLPNPEGRRAQRPSVSDDIKRTGPPTTRNGVEWEIVLSGEPEPAWMELFRNPDEDISPATPHALFFRGRIILFRANETHVERWIKSIDHWIAVTNRRHAGLLDEKRRERGNRESPGTSDRARVRELNERFRDL